MSIYFDIKHILNECKCKNDNFLLDFENKMIVSKSVDTISSCENDCGLITKVTMYLISNNIDYDLLNDYSIKLHLDE
ncbi:hypothetical protein ACMC56_11540 [Campylobacterota bacterium DY0563]